MLETCQKVVAENVGNLPKSRRGKSGKLANKSSCREKVETWAIIRQGTEVSNITLMCPIRENMTIMQAFLRQTTLSL